MALPTVSSGLTVPRTSFWRTMWSNAVMAPKTTLGLMRVDFVLGSIFIIPLTQMAFFAFVVRLGGGGASEVAYTALGNAIATVTYSSVFSVCQTTDSEKNQGTMEHLLVTPTNRFALYFGRGLVPILLSLATAAVGVVYAVSLFGVAVAPSSVPALAVSIALTAFAMVGFGLLIGGVALYLRTSLIIGNIFLFIGLLLSGVNFPISQLPVPLQWVGYGYPLTWGLDAVRAAAAGDPIGVTGVYWLAVAVAGLVSYLVAVGLWEIFERRALATGSIARY